MNDRRIVWINRVLIVLSLLLAGALAFMWRFPPGGRLYYTQVPWHIARQADWRQGEIACLTYGKARVYHIGQPYHPSARAEQITSAGKSVVTYAEDQALFYVQHGKLVGVLASDGLAAAYPTFEHGLGQFNLDELFHSGQKPDRIEYYQPMNPVNCSSALFLAVDNYTLLVTESYIEGDRTEITGLVDRRIEDAVDLITFFRTNSREWDANLKKPRIHTPPPPPTPPASR